MSRWDVAPTPFQRWAASHRSGLRGALVLFIVILLALVAYDLATEGFSSSIAAAALALLGLLGCCIAVGSVGRYVENWDRDHPLRDSS